MKEGECLTVDLRGIHLSNLVLSDKHLTNISFDYSTLNKIDFSGSIVQCSFSFARIGCNFSYCNMLHAKFDLAQIIHANFTSANLSYAKFNDAYISGTEFFGANISGVMFLNSIFLNTYFHNVRLDYDTNFGLNTKWLIIEPKNDAIYTESLIRSREDGYYEGYPKFLNRSSEYMHAKKIYLSLKMSAKSCGLLDLAGGFHYREHKCILEAEKNNKNALKYTIKLFQNLLTGFGEKPYRTIIFAFATIILFSFFYLFSGFEYSTGTGAEIVNRELSFSPVNLDSTLDDFWSALYMSVITFSTLGYGDAHPIGITRLFASIESLMGIFLTSLFVATYTRITIRD